MIYVHAPLSSAALVGGGTPAEQVPRMMYEQVLPHYMQPSTRQKLTLREEFSNCLVVAVSRHSSPPSVAAPSALAIDEEMILDSPPFKPAALAEFEARGFERRNRWARKK